jgi:hypothetical protein
MILSKVPTFGDESGPGVMLFISIFSSIRAAAVPAPSQRGDDEALRTVIFFQSALLDEINALTSKI